MKNIHIVIGTRPDAIKMAPVYKELKKREGLQVKLISSGQHRELLNQVYESFNIFPDVDLCVMKAEQNLTQLTTSLLTGFENLFIKNRPDLILGHGDTTTCYSTALSAFYHSIPFYHVEAGLRTYRLDSPFPEEFNRQSVAQLATHHFAPSLTEKDNLLEDGVLENAITVTGGTIHDAIQEMDKGCRPVKIDQDKKIVVFTLHRREHANQLHEMMSAIKNAAKKRADVLFISPLHPNPVVRATANEIFNGLDNVILCEALRYPEFLNLLRCSHLILTDSGGVQEEASYLGKQTFLLRENTERQDGLQTGLTKVIGNNPESIESHIINYLKMNLRQKNSSIISSTKRASEIVADFVYERFLA